MVRIPKNRPKKTQVHTTSETTLTQVYSDSPPRQISWALFELILCIALSAGTWLVFFSMFPDPTGQETLTTALVVALPAVLYVLCRIPVIGRFVPSFVIFTVAIVLVVNYRQVWNGVLVLTNLVIQIVNQLHGFGMVAYAVNGNVELLSRDATIALYLCLVLVAAAVVYSVRQKHVLLGFLMTAIPVLIGLFLQVPPSTPLLILLLLAWIGLFVLVAIKGDSSIRIARGQNNTAPNSKNVARGWRIHKQREGALFIRKKEGVGLLVPILSLSLLVVLAITLVFGTGRYRPVREVAQAKETLIQTEERLRFQKLTDRPAALGEGILSSSEPLPYDAREVMRVTMQTPLSMHLRGFIGATYSNDRWNTIGPQEFSGEYEGLIEWLHQRGYYPQQAADHLYRLSNVYGISQVTVENTRASSKYLYLPYEVAMSDKLTTADANYQYDGAVLSRGIMGQRKYEFTTFTPEMGNYGDPEVAARLGAASQHKGFAEVSQSEQAYRRFVYVNYLAVPKGQENDLEQAFDLGEVQGQSGIKVLERIRRVYKDNFVHDTEVSNAEGSSDPLKYFLADSHAGNDMYFATAATLALRQCGIPARYVEGYYLSPEEIERFREQKDVTFPVLDSMSHAWVEIYVDEVGWVPAEVVPGYFTLEEKEELGETQPEPQPEPQYQQFFDIDVPLSEEAERRALPEKGQFPWWVLIFGELVAALCTFEFIGHRRAKKKWAEYGVVITDEKARELYKAIETLLLAGGVDVRDDPYRSKTVLTEKFSPDFESRFRKVVEAMSALRFGGLSLDKETQQQMAALRTDLACEVLKKKGVVGRLVMKHVRFIA